MSSNAVESLLSVEFIYCACGCGLTRPRFDKRHIERKVIAGHQNRGKNNGRYKGRIQNNQQYIKIFNPNHHHKDNRNLVHEHRLIWEEYYNCCLLPWIIIHHKNGIKDDNRIENLQPMTQSEHLPIHLRKDMSNRICVYCGSTSTWKDNRGYYNWHKEQNGYSCHKCCLLRIYYKSKIKI